MRGTDNRVPLLTAILVALLLAAIPGTAQAQLSFGSGPSAPTNNCNNKTGVELCQCQMSNGHIQRAQGQTVANLKVFSNTNILSINYVYCWENTILPALQSIGALTSGAGGASPLGSAIWAAVSSILSGLINSVCQQVASAIRAVISYIKNLICIPIPHFNLSLGGMSFGGGSCAGMSLFSLLGQGTTRPTTPSGWQLWNLSSP